MSKIIKFSEAAPSKFGYRKAKRKRKIDLEDFGQLNLFNPPPSEAKVVKMGSYFSPFEEALALDEMGDERSREYYLKAIEAGDSVADAYCNLGIIESNTGNFVRAIDCFTNCLRYDPRHFEAHYNLANIYADAGDLKLAKLHYEISIQLEPDFASSYYNLGVALALDHQYEAAIKALLKYKGMASFDEKINVEELIKSLERSLKS